MEQIEQKITPEQVWDAAIKWYQYNERMNYIPETEEEYMEAIGEQQRELSQFVPPNKEQFCSKYGLSTPVTDDEQLLDKATSFLKEADVPDDDRPKYYSTSEVLWLMANFACKHSVTPVLDTIEKIIDKNYTDHGYGCSFNKGQALFEIEAALTAHQTSNSVNTLTELGGKQHTE